MARSRSPEWQRGSKPDGASRWTPGRSYLEEGIAVLDAVGNGATDRWLLLRETRLPWSKLREIVGSMAEAGLLRVEDLNSSERFKLQSTGVHVVKRYKEIVQRIESARTVIEVASFER